MIRVKKGKNKYPFSRGILSKSITSTGLPIDIAYDIVATIQRTLKEKGIKEIRSKEIKEMVREELIERGLEEHERYYRISREIAHLKKPILLLVGGATGVGKSTISAELAHRLAIERVIGTDAIREIMRFMMPEDVVPVLHESSFMADEVVKSPYIKNDLIYAFTQQVSLVSEGIHAFINRGLTEGLNTIINGIHLVPGFIEPEYKKDSFFFFHYIIHLQNKDRHMQHFQLRSEGSHRDPERYIKNLNKIRKIQRYLKDMAERENVKIIENKGFEKTIEDILEHIFSILEREVLNG